MLCDSAADSATAEKLKALAHPARLTILRALAAREKSCCGDLVDNLDLAQSTVSQHLKILLGAGLIENRATGSRAAYRVNFQAIQDLESRIAELLGCLSPECQPPEGPVHAESRQGHS